MEPSRPRNRPSRTKVSLAIIWVTLVALSVWYCWRGCWRQDGPPHGTAPHLVSPTGKQAVLPTAQLVQYYLSLGSPGHCTAIVGLDEEPRCPQWTRLLFWFGTEARWRVRYFSPPAARPLVASRRSERTATSAPLQEETPVAEPSRAVVAPLHLAAMKWMLQSGCRSMAVFEDDTSLDLLPYWEEPLTSLASQLRRDRHLALQLDTRLKAFTEKLGRYTDLKLESLTLNCTHRHWISCGQQETLGTGAYLLTSHGASRILQRFGDDPPIHSESFAVLLNESDSGGVFRQSDLVSLWPPYLMAWNPSTALPWKAGETDHFDRVQRASSIVAATANLQRAAACAFQLAQ
ncbi:hypothetical protein CCYA_CCYA12G3434 [Cyanidiococcus yangmingshanensis]|nr:hypothetical protein CCYA_CCYA12G3434 [Cyanidiococcus yangmingshanensis]